MRAKNRLDLKKRENAIASKCCKISIGKDLVYKLSCKSYDKETLERFKKRRLCVCENSSDGWKSLDTWFWVEGKPNNCYQQFEPYDKSFVFDIFRTICQK